MSTSKHFLATPGPLVASALSALTYTNPSLVLDAANKIVYHLPTPQGGKVAVVSGGGSGHEPSFSALVGRGLLSAGVAGTIFASPGAEQVRRCVTRLGRESKDQKGVLIVVMNYTGDILNFGMAVEKARASGVPIEMVVVGDDVGVGRAKAGKVGRRGIAGTVLVVKAAGAAAEKGASLADVHKVALQVSENLISVGASLAHVHVPGRVADDEDDGLGADEIELGMGIHNEPGSERLKGVDLASLVKTMLTRLLDQSDSDRAFLNVKSSDKVVALINNLGGVSPLEFGAITHEALAQLKSTYQIVPVRVLAGTYMTSLNGPGFSISLLRVQDTGLGSGMQVLDLLDAPTEAAGWVPSADPQTWTLEGGRQFDSVDPSDESASSQPSGISIDPAIARDVFAAGLKRVIAAEPEVTRFDTVVGDGDCGTGLKRGADAVQALLDNPDTAQIKDLSVLLDRVAGVVEDTMDGTSGALYAIFVNALNHGLRVAGLKQPGPVSVQNHWVPALESALEGLGRYTPAKVGNRTLVDALAPFVTGLKESGNVNAAAGKARDGAEKTKGMGASLGRTVYIGGSGFKEVPDPGAWGLSEFFLGLGEATGK